MFRELFRPPEIGNIRYSNMDDVKTPKREREKKEPGGTFNLSGVHRFATVSGLNDVFPRNC